MNPSEGFPTLTPPSNAALDEAPVEDGKQKVLLVGLSFFTSSNSCLTRLLPPLMIFFPPIGTRLTVLVSEGSNLTAVPAQMLRRLHNESKNIKKKET